MSFGLNALENGSAGRRFLPGRREIIASALSGAGAAILVQTGIGFVKSDFLPGNVLPDALIRPPGALPEEDFLRRCIRCGTCMKACPSNTLQPVWLEAGLGGFFSPKVLPRRGPCYPFCNVCGSVCPTGALRPLSPQEKMWAKIGTAHIIKHKCLAWEWNKECLVCYETCPYGAIDIRRVPEAALPVPFVVPHKCSGCGACEYHCPAQAGSSIVVEPMDALRIKHGSYIIEGKAMGLDLRADPDRDKKPWEDRFDSVDSDVLPPGFSN
ncbi:MAG: 4Fe-4S dicluster domain-containing protein [Syntrophales bacterium]|nr:4Fe-4S dicluster domain-containing protein [Syntrophales bacterium]